MTAAGTPSHKSHAPTSPVRERPEDIVDLQALAPSIVADLRYCTNNNFLGRPADGYEAEVVLITAAAAGVLQAVQTKLAQSGLGLKIFDAYRPQRAVDDFVRWAHDLTDTATKAEYYPHIDKQALIPLGYLVEHSAHSRGSTVDLTLVDTASGEELDMGSHFDFFDPISWPASSAVTETQRENRLFLHSVMLAHGFAPLQTEWWHFTLQNEPYPDTCFDFPVR